MRLTARFSGGAWRRPLQPVVGQLSGPSFPCLNITAHDSEQRMWLRTLYGFKSIAQFGIADRELRQETVPLIHDLTARDGNAIGAPRPADFPTCKHVASTHRLRVNATKILRDRATRTRVRAESMQLRVM
jgi:hypothetical protein